MLKELNLLPKNTQKIRRNNQMIFYLKWASRIVAFLLMAAVLVEFSWVQITNLMVMQTKERIKNLQVEIQSQEEIEGKYLFYQKVLNQASDQISKRKNFIEITAELFKNVPPTVVIQTISFQDNLLVFQGKTDNYSALLSGLTQLKNASDSQYFGNISVGDISRAPDGTYSFKLDIELKTQKASSGDKTS
jgi:hypothetical protein